LEGGGAMVGQEMAQLEVARLGITELARGGQGTKVGAFSFVDHGQFEGDFVVVGNLELTGRAARKYFLFLMVSMRSPLVWLIHRENLV